MKNFYERLSSGKRVGVHPGHRQRLTPNALKTTSVAQFDVRDRDDFDHDVNYTEPVGHITTSGQSAPVRARRPAAARWGGGHLVAPLVRQPTNCGRTGPSVGGRENDAGGSRIGTGERPRRRAPADGRPGRARAGKRPFAETTDKNRLNR
jgi:hypothetical protein